MDISVHDLKEKMDSGKYALLDVREDWEFEQGNIGGKHIPLGSLPTRLDELSEWKDDEIVVMCRSGKRSASAVSFLKQHGFAQARNLSGGILAWKSQFAPGLQV